MARESERVALLRRKLGDRLRLVRSTAGLTQGDLARAAFCDRTTIAHIESGRARADKQFWTTADTMCRADGTLIAAFDDVQAAKAAEELRQRVAALADARTPLDGDGTGSRAATLPNEDRHIGAALEWLDSAAGWSPGTARREVAARFAAVDVGESRDRAARRGRVEQREVADALRSYYRGQAADGYGSYRVTADGTAVDTSIVTRPEWLDLDCGLGPRTDQLRYSPRAAVPAVTLDELGANRAVERLAETLALETRLIDLPLYALADLDVSDGKVAGTLGVTRFAQFGLTLDLLEGELLGAVAAGTREFPLRDKYLPDLSSVVDFSRRLCVGGVVAVCAIARPAGPHGEADYLLLVQQRSGHVVNSARRLALIPKGFHQPLADYRDDARVRVTVLREMEEELFGRQDVDNTECDQRSADPMHPSRLSEPLRWLLGDPARLRLECTGVGLNAVNGNYELASLIVINDEDFWNQHGGLIEANWESSTLRRYSSRDREAITQLIADEAWTVEGPFALAQGLRRLAAVDPERVDLPKIDWHLV